MNKRRLSVALLAAIGWSLGVTTEAQALCFETPGYSSGSAEVASWLAELKKVSAGARNVELFIEQSRQGHYVKLCNEPSQKAYFMSHHIKGKGQWQCRSVCGDAAVESNVENGFTKIRRLAKACDDGLTGYELCWWVKK